MSQRQPPDAVTAGKMETQRIIILVLTFYFLSTFSSLGAVSNSDVGGHGFPLFPVSCSFDDLDFTDFQQLAEAFHEVQPWFIE